MKNGGIFGDFVFGDEVVTKKKKILDITEEEISTAQNKLESDEMLFPEDEADYKRITKGSRKKDRSERRRERRESTRVVPVVSQEILDEVGDALGVFDAETANKRVIRQLRKALQKLSLARYPKKKRERKEKKSKEVSKKTKKKK